VLEKGGGGGGGRAEGETLDDVVVALEFEEARAGRDVPYTNRAVVAAGGDNLSDDEDGGGENETGG
jgi:hypothetical protein